jgi:hypothetical protein
MSIVFAVTETSVIPTYTKAAETTTPVPTTFPDIEIDSPVVDLIDFRITVKGDLIEAIFYLKDVPPELTFNRDGVDHNEIEYLWEICVDVDNNKETGILFPLNPVSIGSDYCLSASRFKFSSTPVTMPIEDAVQVSIWQLDRRGASIISDGNIIVNSQENTIKLSGTMPGITNSSQFYYQTLENEPGGDGEGEFGTLFYRVFFEN